MDMLCFSEGSWQESLVLEVIVILLAVRAQTQMNTLFSEDVLKNILLFSGFGLTDVSEGIWREDNCHHMFYPVTEEHKTHCHVHNTSLR